MSNDYGCSNGSRYCSELNTLQYVASSSDLIRITGSLGGHPGNPDIGDEDNDEVINSEDNCVKISNTELRYRDSITQ